MKTESLHGEYKNKVCYCWLLFVVGAVVCWLFDVVGGVVCCLLIVGRWCSLCVVVLLFCENSITSW